MDAGHTFATDHSLLGIGVASKYDTILEKLHHSVAKFLHTEASHISFVHNTGEALSLLAEGFPFAKDDEIISYVHEYPSNHYPWLLQGRRGAKLVLLKNQDTTQNHLAGKRPCGWSWEELQEKITSRTRIIALSHVQFTSGFACDLVRLGKLCKEKKIYLVIDAAQSMGSLPIYPEKWNISAMASSCWKWLLGPIGSGILYTSPELREELGFTMAGADLMEQGDDYLNHNWKPHLDGRRFEYSTVAYEFAAQLLACFDHIFNRYGIEKIHKEIKELQNLFIDQMNRKDTQVLLPLHFSPENSSGILSFVAKDCDPNSIVSQVQEEGLSISTRGGYVRVGMHFYNTPEEIHQAVDILSKISTRRSL